MNLFNITKEILKYQECCGVIYQYNFSLQFEHITERQIMNTFIIYWRQVFLSKGYNLGLSIKNALFLSVCKYLQK